MTDCQIQPCLFFEGRCDEAIAFYQRALGAETTMLVRYKDSPEPQHANAHPPGSENKVLHARLRIGQSTILVSDGRCGGAPAFQGFSLSLTVREESEATRLFAALSEGGQVRMPLAPTFFSPRFGMVADRFGVGWMVYVQA